MRSPIYCDNRLILSYPEVRKIVVKGLCREAHMFEGINGVAGVATAGIPWGAMLADHLELPFLYIRNKPKEHGLNNLIEGRLPEDPKILVVEDLISTGGSSLEAVKAIADAGARVLGVLALFQYGFPVAHENFKKTNTELRTLTNFETLLLRAQDSGYITSEEYENLKSWNQDPKKWSDHFLSQSL